MSEQLESADPPIAVERHRRAHVGVWTMPVPPAPASLVAARELNEAERLLSADERSDLSGIAHRPTRRCVLAARVLLRSILGDQLGLAPRDVPLLRPRCRHCGGTRRPVLDPALQAGLWFSLSHTTELVAVAVASTPVGLDVETLPGAGELGDDAELIAAADPRERRALHQLPRSGRARAAVGCWARREAYGKALGVGLSAATERAYVGLPGRRVRPCPDLPVIVDDLPGQVGGPRHVLALSWSTTADLVEPPCPVRFGRRSASLPIDGELDAAAPAQGLAAIADVMPPMQRRTTGPPRHGPVSPRGRPTAP